MAIYSYRARDAQGKRVTGRIEAAGKTELVDKLHRMGYMVTAVGEARPELKISSIFEKFKGVRTGDMLMFYIQLASMISSGITILASLSTLGKQIENRTLRDAVNDVSKQIESGSNLSRSFTMHPRLFPKLFINMIKAGEASGKLDNVLVKYANFFEYQEDLKEKINGALFYPMILLCVGMAVILFIVTFVIPQFAQIYMQAGIKLPGPTLIVYNAGQAIRNYWYLVIIALFAAAIGLKFYSNTKPGRRFLDLRVLKIPVVGPLIRKVSISRFARTLSTLLGSGVPILESLDITKDIIGNEILAGAVGNVRMYVEKGERMAEPLRISGEFPQDVVQMVAVGEETGNIDGMLDKVADLYDIAVNYTVKKLTTIIEPVFLVIMGGMVGLIMASMLMPIFDMVKTLRH